MTNNRRTLLRFAAAAAAGASLGPLWRRARAQTGAAPLDTVPLRDGLSQVTGAGGNMVLLATEQGAALVDSGAPEASDMLRALLDSRLGGRGVDALLNTHWHLDHTGGNEPFGAAGTPILAHENTRLWMSTEHFVDWQDRTYPPRPKSALPTRTFYASDPQPLVLKAAGEEIEYGHLREAHTDGDIYVLFRNRNVLVAGGAVAVGAYPVLDYATGGWIGGLVEATRKLLALADANTLIVPAAGPAQRRAHLEAQYAMLTTVRGRIEELMRKGRSIAEMLAAGVTNEFDAAWGANRDRFVANVYNGLWWQGRLDGSL